MSGRGEVVFLLFHDKHAATVLNNKDVSFTYFPSQFTYKSQ